MIDILAETLQKLTARRGLVARELATLDEAIGALQRVCDEAPKHGGRAARPALVPSSTSPAPPKMPAPPPPATRPAPADDGEDPTDRAIRLHRELHPMPESAGGMRARTKARTA